MHTSLKEVGNKQTMHIILFCFRHTHRKYSMKETHMFLNKKASRSPCSQTDEHLELPVLADVSGSVVNGAHEAAKVPNSRLPVFVWCHLPLLRTFKVDLSFFCYANKRINIRMLQSMTKEHQL